VGGVATDAIAARAATGDDGRGVATGSIRATVPSLLLKIGSPEKRLLPWITPKPSGGPRSPESNTGAPASL